MEFLANGFLSEEENLQLLKFHELVLMLFKADSDDVKADVTRQLDELIPKIKELSANFKKVTKKEAGDGEREE